MAKATGFQIDLETGDINMNRGDTGAYKVRCRRTSGEDWPAESRMLYTIKDSSGKIVLQRIYRLDDAWGLGNGVVQIEFHNSDTDTWEFGTYSAERRYNVHPTWKGGVAPEGRCVNALETGDEMIEGVPVRTVWQGSLNIVNVLGDI